MRARPEAWRAGSGCTQAAARRDGSFCVVGKRRKVIGPTTYWIEQSVECLFDSCLFGPEHGRWHDRDNGQPTVAEDLALPLRGAANLVVGCRPGDTNDVVEHNGPTSPRLRAAAAAAPTMSAGRVDCAASNAKMRRATRSMLRALLEVGLSMSNG